MSDPTVARTARTARAARAARTARAARAARLADLRAGAGLSKKRLCDLAGLARSHVHSLEAGLWDPSTATSSALADVLGCTLDWLVNGKGRKPTAAEQRRAVLATEERRGQRLREA